MPPPIDLTGQRFGRLVVTGPRHRKGSATYWTCMCDCGVAPTIAASSLRRGLTASCGCLRSEITTSRNRKHDGSARGHRQPEYTIWNLVHQRCANPQLPAYHRYGGRGIRVCDRWSSYTNFIADMGPRPTAVHTIERIDNNGNYEPGNCRWADRTDQANNTRKNRHLALAGVTRTQAEWSRVTGIKTHTIGARVDRLGWSVERALTTPTRPMRRA